MRAPFLAGGFIRACVTREAPSDIDLFCATVDDARVCANALVQDSHRKIIETDNAFTVRGLSIPVQFIHRWTFDRPEDAIASFDFSIAQAAVWHDGHWQSLCADGFYPDLAAKRLIYLHPVRNEDAGGSMLRLLKFYRKGYTAPLDTIAGVIARLMSGVKRSLDEMGEAETAQILTGMLREVDPLSDPLHVFHEPTLADATAEGVEMDEAQDESPKIAGYHASMPMLDDEEF